MPPDAAHVFEQNVEVVVRNPLGIVSVLQEPNLPALFKLPGDALTVLALVPHLEVSQRLVLASTLVDMVIALLLLTFLPLHLHHTLFTIFINRSLINSPSKNVCSASHIAAYLCGILI